MAMTITASIMTTIRATIPTDPRRCWFLALGILLAAFALVNLFLTLTPAARLNEQIDRRLLETADLSGAERLERLNELKDKQDMALSHKPADPYAWSRLSWLRMETDKDQKAAFAALRMSDLVSPWEAPQLPERAMMWRKYRNAQTPEQKAYQDELWQKAFSLRHRDTDDLARINGMRDDVGDALKRRDPALYEEWKALKAGTSKP